MAQIIPIGTKQPRRRKGDRQGPSIEYAQVHQVGSCNFHVGGTHTMVFVITGPNGVQARICRECLRELKGRGF